ncbi:amino acid ABC transporter permease [Enterococcus timonensis]|uniref:amino acid ABC transporter permease n=1 Tax=Enterococcus timonensis TaxID=1852364 RepID=UPI0008D941D6|nr:amino acid ABC transporter permease [Enterococcus timonensis]
MNFSFLSDFSSYFINGTVVTLFISLITVVLGAVLGTLLALLKLSGNRFLRFLASAYIEIFRGTPMFLQILIGFILLYGKIPVPRISIMNVDLSLLLAGLIPLAMNSAAYVAEIIRGGIQAVDKGQTEAAYSLGLKQSKTMRFVILPQAIRNILPALGNEFVTVIKDSSLLSAIGVAELVFGATSVQNITYIGLEPLLAAAMIYFILTFTTSRLLGLWEKKLNKGM